ncbi:HAD-IA family hydrolase [Paracoccus sp. S-4012]|uniref:HAD-IA family hydrolase n=1 Tax=Paracoccus sp. S-4012 TaxID=2665648 RepID=UPI0012B09D6D|nr:HAD-IA family hydrolase [Paracoccus sp. S-4012]MRX51034.1 HAD-IA family hydrolase [Paracoccus sp. S-4012]
MRLVVFDVDGTLIDSQHHIHAAMSAAFAEAGLEPPTLSQVHAIVGLTLPIAVAAIRPDLPHATVDRIVGAYKASFLERRLQEDAPLFPGVVDCLTTLAACDDLVLGIATGKGRRGLDAMLDLHGLSRFFMTTQCADGHPSKPHPAMLEAACAAVGIPPARAIMVGDTTFDIEMAVSAGVLPVGVQWGYHPVESLTAAGAGWIAPDYPALTRWVGDWAA